LSGSTQDGRVSPIRRIFWRFGVVLNLVLPHYFERLSIVYYLGTGWMILVVCRQLSAASAAVDFWLLVAGGLVYSAGVVFFLSELLPFHKPIRHGLRAGLISA